MFQSLKNVDYYVKDKMLLESILEVEFETVTDKGFFYNGMAILIQGKSYSFSYIFA